jgi:EAL domain-containing protein (putative c-di-GMP-specific phosphodiesterase class I)
VDGVIVARAKQTALTFFLFVLAVECLIAFIGRAPRAAALLGGDPGWRNLLALTGLVWLPFVILASVRLTAELNAAGGGTANRKMAAAAHERAVGIRHRTESLLADEALQIALQPVVGINTGTWVGAEALSRFPDNRPPDLWFAEAHEVGLGVELELLAMRRALEVVHALPNTVALSFNASPALILDRRFAEALQDPTLPLGRLVVEITEHAIVDRYDDLMSALEPLRAQGLQVSVDDTGAGYASLRHVLKIRPDNIKLDRSFVADAATDPATRAMITAIVLAAMEMQASVTAEGVEDSVSLRAIELLGVDSVQGYLLARPSTEPWEWAIWAPRNWMRVLQGAEHADDSDKHDAPNNH